VAEQLLDSQEGLSSMELVTAGDYSSQKPVEINFFGDNGLLGCDTE
jgi:hypothetical protein